MTQLTQLTQLTQPTGHDGLPTLVVGPSLGTTAAELWGPVAAALAGEFRVLGWDLPGHGDIPAADGPLTVPGLADRLADSLRDAAVGPVHYAGDSLGGAVGLQLLVDHPGLVSTATLCCTGAVIGTPASWAERAATVRAGGTAAVVDSSADRWFSPGFARRDPGTVERLLATLRSVDDDGYAAACDALGAYDLRDRLGEVDVAVLAVAGTHDRVTPPASLLEIAVGVAGSQVRVLDAGHLLPVEVPGELAALIRSTSLPTVPTVPTVPTLAAGDAVRREVLGSDHVDRAAVPSGRVGHDFQDFITGYAWGTVWTRPGLVRRERSMVTLTALVALGHLDELALHLRAARTNGLSVAEIEEVLLQTAIYCGVPAANSAFRVARQVLDDGSDA